MHASGFECVFENCFSYFTSKTYVVGTQKNHLEELKLMDKNLYTQKFCLSYLRES